MRYRATVALCMLTALLAQADDVNLSDWDFTAEFESFRERNETDYQRFVDEVDGEFSEWLNQAWEFYRRAEPRQSDLGPKPVTPPVRPDSRTPIASETIKTAPPRQSTSDTEAGFEFFGHGVVVTTWPVELPSLASVDSDSVADAWRLLARTDYKPVLDDLQSVCAELACGDWARVLLVRDYSRWLAINGNMNASRTALLQWFLLDKLGYRVRGARVEEAEGSKSRLVVLYNPLQTVFAVPYFNINGDEYYPLEPLPGGKLFTYPSGFTTRLAYSRRPLELSFERTLAIPGMIARRSLVWTTEPEATIELQYDEGRRRYLDSHPQLDLKWYFAAPVDPVLSEGIRGSIASRLEGLSTREKLTRLLHFVQYSVSYETDMAQFGRENYLLPEQLLYYPAADCEDRSLFYAALVRTLLDLPVVGVLYPGHVATAVAMPGESASVGFEHAGVWYELADPTYIGAGLGESMLHLKAVRGELIIHGF